MKPLESHSQVTYIYIYIYIHIHATYIFISLSLSLSQSLSLSISISLSISLSMTMSISLSLHIYIYIYIYIYGRQRKGKCFQGGSALYDIFWSSVKSLLVKCPSVQWQPAGLTIRAKERFLGAGFLGAPPISLVIVIISIFHQQYQHQYHYYYHYYYSQQQYSHLPFLLGRGACGAALRCDASRRVPWRLDALR